LFPPLLEAAARLAAQGHYHHFRKREPGDSCCEENSGDALPADCVPYITHLMGTMGILARIGARDELLAAALLHDYLEDVPDPQGRETIRAAAGDEVLALVLAVTEEKRPEQDSSDTWQLRKQEQIDQIARIPEEAVLLKSADVLHNLLSLLMDLDAAPDHETVWRRLNAGPERQLWYFEGVLEAGRRRLGSHRLMLEFADALDRLRRHLDR
jgi:(p)ppGpp synthase/HD superfamily hydrolase